MYDIESLHQQQLVKNSHKKKIHCAQMVECLIFSGRDCEINLIVTTLKNKNIK